MKRLTVAGLTILACLGILSIAQAEDYILNTYPDGKTEFSGVFDGNIYCVDFEGIATTGGQAGSVNIAGDTFPGLTLSAREGAEGLYVGIPDTSLGTDNAVNFYANDFFPTSGAACLSPDFTNSPAPIGTVRVVFDEPVDGVGAYFLDAETSPGAGSYIKAFDRDGNELGFQWVGKWPDNSRVFAGIIASNIKSAELSLGYGSEGVGLDDLCYGRMEGPVGIIEPVINIKPYSWPNAINTCSEGATPVIIWGSEYFNVNRINLDSLTFGDKGLKVVGKGKKELFVIDDFGQPTDAPECLYVDGCDGIDPTPDGYLDLNAKFDTYQLSTFTEGAQTLGKVCFDYDVYGDGNELTNVCISQTIYLSQDCAAAE